LSLGGSASPKGHRRQDGGGICAEAGKDFQGHRLGGGIMTKGKGLGFLPTRISTELIDVLPNQLLEKVEKKMSECK
jgi:hypothetical protein